VSVVGGFTVNIDVSSEANSILLIRPLLITKLSTGIVADLVISTVTGDDALVQISQLMGPGINTFTVSLVDPAEFEQVSLKEEGAFMVTFSLTAGKGFVPLQSPDATHVAGSAGGKNDAHLNCMVVPTGTVAGSDCPTIHKFVVGGVPAGRGYTRTLLYPSHCQVPVSQFIQSLYSLNLMVDVPTVVGVKV